MYDMYPMQILYCAAKQQQQMMSLTTELTTVKVA